MKKWFALFVMGIVLMISSVAIAQTYTNGDYQYTVSDNQATITKYSGTASVLNVPATLGGYPVTAIGDMAFYDCAALASIVLPESITSIGTSAFSTCDSLKEIKIPSKVTSIGQEAFFRCPNLVDVHIAENVTSIGVNVFVRSDNVVVVTTEGSYAHQWCIDNHVAFRLESYTSGDYLYTVSNNQVTITKYTGTTSILNIPATIEGYSVTAIGDSAFVGNTTISSVVVPEGVVSIGKKAFQNCTSLQSIDLPDSVRSIGERVFLGCASLKSIDIPSGVPSIPELAFYECRSLETITLHEGLLTIERMAFDTCIKVTNVVLPESLTYIGNFAFRDCNYLTEIRIPYNVTTLDGNVFGDCDRLVDVYITEGTTSMNGTFFNFARNMVVVTTEGSFAHQLCVEYGFPFRLEPSPEEEDVYVTIQSAYGGTITEGISGNYSPGSILSIEASPKYGYGQIFSHWESSNGGSFTDQTSASTSFAVPSVPTTVTAYFKDEFFTDINSVILKISAAEGGTIWNDDTEEWVSVFQTRCLETRKKGIQATSNDGYIFDYWSSNNGGIFENEMFSHTAFLAPSFEPSQTVPVIEITAHFKKETELRVNAQDHKKLTYLAMAEFSYLKIDDLKYYAKIDAPALKMIEDGKGKINDEGKESPIWNEATIADPKAEEWVYEVSYNDFFRTCLARWNIVEQLDDPETGFNAVAFKHQEKDEVVIAFRGSDDIGDSEHFTKDWVENDFILYASNQIGPQLDNAMKFYEDVKEKYDGCKISATGHSLGGGLALSISTLFNIDAQGFNSVPMFSSILQRFPSKLVESFEGIDRLKHQDDINEHDILAGLWDTKRIRQASSMLESIRGHLWGQGALIIATWIAPEHVDHALDFFKNHELRIPSNGFEKNHVVHKDYAFNADTWSSLVDGLDSLRFKFTKCHGLETLFMLVDKEFQMTPVLDTHSYGPDSEVQFPNAENLESWEDWGYKFPIGFQIPEQVYLILGGTGNQYLFSPKAHLQNDMVYGGNGEDQIFASAGNDVLIGGKGNDTLYGNTGKDQYIYSYGDGVDTIVDIDGETHVFLEGFPESSRIEVLPFNYTDGRKLYHSVTDNGVLLLRICTDRAEDGTNYPWLFIHKDGEIINIGDKQDVAVKRFTFECPLSIEIMNESGTTIAQLPSGQEQAQITEYGHFYVYQEEDGSYGKVIELFDGCSLRGIGEEEGTFDVSVEEMGSENPIALGARNLPLRKGSQVILNGDFETGMQVVIDHDGDGISDFVAQLTSDLVGIPIVTKEAQAIEFDTSELTITYGETPTQRTATAAGTITYESSDPSVATVDSSTGIVTVLKVGSTDITAIAAETDDYASAQKSYTLTVQPKPITPEMILLDQNSYVYDSAEKLPVVTVKDGDAVLQVNSDYTVSGDTSGTDVNTYTITITGIGNYTGTPSVQWSITIQPAPAAPVGLQTVAASAQGLSDGKIIGVNDTMEWSTDSAFANATMVDEGQTEITGLAAGTYYVRYKATANTQASNYATVTVADGPSALQGTMTITGQPKFGEQLTAQVTGSNNSGTLSYQWKRGEDEIANAQQQTYTLTQDDIGKVITCVVTSSVETGSLSASTAAIEKADGPAAPTGLTTADPTTYGGSDGKIAGVNSTMEYASSPDFDDAQDCTGSAITGLEAGIYYVRVKETETTEAGLAAQIRVSDGVSTLPVPKAKADLKYTGSEQTGVEEGTGYTLTGHKATNVGSYTATATLSPGYKWSDGTTAPKSIAWEIGKADAPTAPTGLTTTAPTTYGGSDGILSGVNSTMEWSSDDVTYQPCTDGSITGLKAGTYYVRFKETENAKAGIPATLVINEPAGSAPVISTASLPNGMVGTAYSRQLQASGTAPIEWSLADGSVLPAGLSISKEGIISGTPAAAGTTSFTVQAKNAIGEAGIALTMTVDPVPVVPQVITVEVAPSYTIIQGKASITTLTIGKGLPDLSANNFASLTVDGQRIQRGSEIFEVYTGSVIIRLHPAYLNTLPVGEHHVVIELQGGVYDGCSVATSLTVVPETGANASSMPPKTGDSSNPIAWSMTMLIALFGVVSLIGKRKRV